MTVTQPKTDTYLSIRCVIPADQEEELPETLASWSVLGTEIHERLDGGVGVTIFLSGTDLCGAEAVVRSLVEIGAQNIEQKSVRTNDWLAGYRERVRPFEVGGCWWVDPHPDRPTAAPVGRRRLVIEPRMAFGTGTHESTQTILMALEAMEVKGLRVLDVGSGSGILALATECLGAKFVVGIDIDATSVWVALEISHQQEWSSCVSYVLGTIECLGDAEFDIVMCNMITSSFLPLVGELRKSLAPGGVAVFSGLLASEVESVSGALAEANFTVTSRCILGDWASLTAVEAPGR